MVEATNLNNTSVTKKSEPSTNTTNLWVVIAVGIVFHLIYMWSIFDIYFRSPLVHGMRHFDSKEIGSKFNTSLDSAKRLVFIVGDGLRADKIFEKSENVAPFLRSRIESGGSWGISHTRVPTESRPGHVAMIAGFYEDVSAVMTGWQENPVAFDSVFNQSNYVLQIGSPDVVRIFKSSTPGHIEAHHYPASMEDFASGNPSSLDGWVFDKMSHLFEKAKTKEEPELYQRLNKDKVVIFLHLLGIDTAGHAYRPSGKGYIDSISFVDKGVERVSKIIDDFYQDNETAFIFTADHGMTTRGSHGDGNPECTRTPFIVWGKGVREQSSGSSRYIQEDGTFTSIQEEEAYVKTQWNLNPQYRKDIKQADMAPLMSALLGSNYPVNNVGILPLSYVGVSDEYRIMNLYANTRQIFEQFKTKQNLKQQATSFFFRPFSDLSHQDDIITQIESNLKAKKYYQAEKECLELIEFALEGLKYYQTYDWTLLMTLVVLSYLGWIFYILTYALKHYTKFAESFQRHQAQEKSSKLGLQLLAILTVVIGCIYLWLQTSPPMYYVYLITPTFFFYNVLLEYKLISKFHIIQKVSKEIFSLSFYLIALELMVVGYFKREIFSTCFIFLGILPGLFDILPSFQPRLVWLIVCIFMSFFTLLPPDYGSDTRLVVFGGALLTAIELFKFYRLKKYTVTGFQKAILCFQVIMLLVATFVVHSTEKSLAARQGLPLVNQVITWTISVISILIPCLISLFASSTFALFKFRMQTIIMGFGVPLILLSVNYEILFYAMFDAALYLWIRKEVSEENYSKPVSKLKRHSSSKTSTSGSTSRSSSPSSSRVSSPRSSSSSMEYLKAENFMTAIFFVFFINVGFFGTGNLATIASFEISSVYRFFTIFEPFAMMVMLILKLAIPLLLVAISFMMIMKVTKTPPFGVFFIIISFFDIMTMNFFFLVTDFGSWMEIGNSISRFAIGNAMILLILVMFAFSHFLTRGVQRVVPTK